MEYLYEFTVDENFFVQVRAKNDKQAFEILSFVLESNWKTIKVVRY